MTKNTIISLIIICFILSCGKKADPEFKQSKNNIETEINFLNRS
tara:strand:- start:447 stop:578 length:132 start_codon:yes stop_codon:yes gene_type:complete